mmetsp:Transcript_23572/g.54866  ORF Transcript_23572/g.54866 Transcript_23572/m.54866 type:complete len:175 (+) Transcript_23572:110-634(+)
MELDTTNTGRVRSVEGPEYDQIYQPQSGYIGPGNGRPPFSAGSYSHGGYAVQPGYAAPTTIRDSAQMPGHIWGQHAPLSMPGGQGYATGGYGMYGGGSEQVMASNNSAMNRNIEPNAVCRQFGWNRWQPPKPQYPLEMYLDVLRPQDQGQRPPPGGPPPPPNYNYNTRGRRACC